jgi:hypothetical protein
METNLVDLGFATAEVPQGAHICQIYSDDDERTLALLKFVEAGLKRREKTACFSQRLDEDFIMKWFAQTEVNLPAARNQGHFTWSDAETIYFANDVFDPERMLALLTQFHENSISAGLFGARVIGEMSPKISHIPGGSRLFEYEASVNSLLKTHPVTAVCQYDARQFDGATIMDVLSVHPFMVVQGNVIQNPFFERPESLVTA